MSESSYASVLDRIYAVGRFPKGRSGVDTVRSLCGLIGNPEKKLRCVLVAGTNGKGSVATKVAAILQHAGLRVGLFTSPHLISFCERIRINGEAISEQAVVKGLQRLFEVVESSDETPSFFDCTTLLALEYFAEHSPDIVVLEVGLGGRLDATNVVNPELSVITSISLDHTEVLGDTVEQIAREKAGIVRVGVPVIIGPTVPRQIVCQVAESEQSVFGLSGPFADFEEENQAIAREAVSRLGIEVPEEAYDQGLTQFAPCRSQMVAKDVLMDVAHNPEALRQMLQRARRLHPQRSFRVVLGLNKDKDTEGCLRAIACSGSPVHLVTPEWGRGRDARDLVAPAQVYGLDLAGASSEISAELARAHALARANGEVLLVCGSFFIMENALRVITMVDSDPLTSGKV